MVTDGQPLHEREERFLEEKGEIGILNKLGRKMGGESINVLATAITSEEDFKVVQRTTRKSGYVPFYTFPVYPHSPCFFQ